MIINVTEEQKRVIEERGHTVIEFKKWCYDVINRFETIITDTWNALMFFLQSVAERIVIPCVEKIRDSLQEFVAICDNLFDKMILYRYEREKYPIVRSLGRKYEPNICNKVIYHRCRDRC